MLNNKGEFISDADGKQLMQIAETENFIFAGVDKLGSISANNNLDQLHINKILALPLVDINAIKKANLSVAIDCVNCQAAKYYRHCSKLWG